ncbi:hypothetical protein Cadr_000030042 [Camelus dromedarius]|uniref:Uncharacterized protein n=1 Tax=Camelus dromedarius TaxID=9838 RepID=A0A5N4CD30_CAMDR|nr:hypothetical protein Cadr_000030042 [Camelus dromedarius]
MLMEKRRGMVRCTLWPGDLNGYAPEQSQKNYIKGMHDKQIEQHFLCSEKKEEIETKTILRKVLMCKRALYQRALCD